MADVARQICVSCNNQNQSYFHKDEKYRIAKCGHAFCEACVSKYLKGGKHMACPECGEDVYEGQLENITLEQRNDLEMSRINTYVNEIYNKTEKDFEDEDDYDTYSERRQEIIVILISGTEEEKQAVNKEIEQYKKDHMQEIRERDSMFRDQLKKKKEKLEELTQMQIKERENQLKEKQKKEEEEEEKKKIENELKLYGESDTLKHIIDPSLLRIIRPEYIPSCIKKKPEIPKKRKEFLCFRRSQRSCGGDNYNIYLKREKEEFNISLHLKLPKQV
ncbi:hypothetical protein WA158_000438 [Blastocystis sp. Blastoise]